MYPSPTDTNPPGGANQVLTDTNHYRIANSVIKRLKRRWYSDGSPALNDRLSYTNKVGIGYQGVTLFSTAKNAGGGV